jgi:hypothetical protein
MTADRGDDPVAAETSLYGDEEAERASGVPLPSLRLLQAAGAIRSHKVAKEHGGYRRTWSEMDVLKASIAAGFSEHFAWNIRLSAAALAKVQPAFWVILIEVALEKSENGDPKASARTFVKASKLDWYGELIDRKFLFLKVPAMFTLLLPEPVRGQTNLLLGVVAKDTFAGISWQVASPPGRKLAESILGPDKSSDVMRMYRLAIAAHDNFLSKATINLSMQVRATWRRLHGLESHFVQEVLQLGTRKPDR